MQKYAVKIDLSSFFTDERQHALILVDPTWRNVEVLQNRVQTIFNVENVRFQTNDGYFIPSEESIEVVKFTDQLKAFIPHSSAVKEKRKKSKRVEENHDEEIIEVAAQAKRKFGTLQQSTSFSSSTPNAPKRSKNFTDGAITPSAAIEHNKNKQNKSCQEPIATVERSKHSSKKSKVKETIATENSLDMSHSSFNSTKTSTKKLANSTLKELNASQQSNKSSSHVFFNESGQIANGHDSDNAPENDSTNSKTTNKVLIKFRCSLGEQSIQTPRLFHMDGDGRNSRSSGTKAQIEIQEIVLLKSSIITATDKTQTELDDTTNATGMTVQEESKSISMDRTQERSELQKEAEPNNSNSKKSQICASTPEAIEEIIPETSVQLPNQNIADVSLQLPEQSITDTSLELTNQNIADDSSLQLTNENVDNTSVQSVEENIDDETLPLIEEQNATDTSLQATQNVNESLQETSSQSSNADESSIIAIDDDDDDDDNDDVEVIAGAQTRNSIVLLDDNKLAINDMLPFCTQLNELPNIGDIVIFKMQLAKSRARNAKTNYIAGKCEYINKRTKVMKLFIAEGHDEICRIPSKFHAVLDDSVENTYINAKLEDLIEPKVLKM